MVSRFQCVYYYFYILLLKPFFSLSCLDDDLQRLTSPTLQQSATVDNEARGRNYAVVCVLSYTAKANDHK